jgi:hypothetical protein
VQIIKIESNLQEKGLFATPELPRELYYSKALKPFDNPQVPDRYFCIDTGETKF